ncbi:MAG: transporter substrate-binding domain-containing protein [Prevotella sp.]|nr:transporter substrate-binding domain-containing protein [Prevotella sp.]
MKRKIFIPMITCLLSFCYIQSAQALFLREYTEENPLVIVSDWEFPPYEYRNDKGDPDGYNVEVLDLILNRLNIPHKYTMQEWNKCTVIFENHEADLIHALAFMYTRRPYVMTQNMITYYNVKAARLKDTPPLQKISDLEENDTLIVKDNDYASLRISEYEGLKCQVEYRSTKDALSGIRSGKYKYYIWGERPINLKLKEYGIDNVVLDQTDIPSGELRIIGYDKELIDAIDDTFARLEQAGEIRKIYDKWFHPETVHNDTSPVTLYILASIIILSIIIFLLTIVVRNRVKKAVHKSYDINQMMSQALSMGSFATLEYDIDSNYLRNIDGHVLPNEGMLPQEFIHRMPPEQGKLLHENNLRLAKGEATTYSMNISLNVGTDEKPEWKMYYGNALAEQEKGRTKYIIYTVKELTDVIREEQEISELGTKYRKMFESNLIAMSFYGKDGYLINVNENMERLCEFNEKIEAFFRETNVFDFPLLKSMIDPTSHDDINACQHMYYPDMGIDKYIEVKVRKIFDDNDQLHYIVFTARDVTAERNMYLELRKHDLEIRKQSEAVNTYEAQLHYLLENSNTFLWKFFPDTQIIRFSRSGRKAEYEESVTEFFEGVEDRYREKALHQVAEVVGACKPYHAVHFYNHTPVEPRPVWYSISGIPVFGKDGQLLHYFGIARNITNLMMAQQKLLEETSRAENSGKLKSAFLANMTHEIRTPLNAIVGFSGLLPVVDTNEERLEFIRIIRNNCDMLIRLINDILEASSMGQALAIKPEKLDFAPAFDDICQTLALRVQEAGVEFIKDNPYSTFPATLDRGRVAQVLTNFTTNAVKYTKQGHIKVGYREQDDGIYFYCEDTGAGIPKEKQDSVFERFVKLNDFVQGTGLGLSICKSIAERCGGKIGVMSEGEGLGSTFWMWTPRYITPPTNNA